MYELTVFVLTATRENHSLAFSSLFCIVFKDLCRLAKFISSGDLISISRRQTSVNAFLNFFAHFLYFVAPGRFFPHFPRIG